MKKLAVFLALIALTACQEIVTSPTALAPSGAAFMYEYAPHPAPPPPTDTSVAAYSGESGSGTFSVVYLFNKPETAGFIHFNVQQPEGTVVSDGARVTYHKGVYSGAGTLSYLAQGGLVTLDLASISQTSNFSRCIESCFNVTFDRATLTTRDGTTSPMRSGVHVTTSRFDTKDGVEVVILAK